MTKKLKKSSIHASLSRELTAKQLEKSSINNRIVLKCAIASRLLLLTLIILWRSLVSPYDTSASINPNCLSSPHQQSTEIKFPSIAALIENSIVWDGVYFVRIAECGYEYDHTYAFSPLLPFCISLLSRTVFALFVPVIGYRAVLGLSAYVLNNIAFVFAATYFHRLSVIVLKNKAAAMSASIFFCFNPASIFYSSIYSESLYALLSIGGLCHVISGASNLATLWFTLSVLARSNGVLNAVYIGFQTIHQIYSTACFKRRAYAVQILRAGALRCICIWVPNILFQAYGYINVCHGRSADEISPWCKIRVPSIYGYIQDHYRYSSTLCRRVGFFKYFQVKQLPNFALAFPIMSLVLGSILYYIKRKGHNFFVTAGFRATHWEKIYSPILLYVEADATSGRVGYTTIKASKATQGRYWFYFISADYVSVTVLPFLWHLTILAGFAFSVMHSQASVSLTPYPMKTLHLGLPQVATRFLSASPPLYWFASYLPVYHKRIGKKLVYLICSYFAAYILLGSLLFSNFYPFT